MLPSGPSGFYNAPVSKGVFLFVGINSLLSAVFKFKHSFHLQLFPHIVRDHQFWRLISTHCAFRSSAEILFGSLLIYHMRLIERQWGTSKFASFVTITSTLSTIFYVAVLASGHYFGLKYVSSGPYAIIFAALWQYHATVPATWKSQLLGMSFSDKYLPYMMAAQLLLSSFPNSAVAGVCGLAAGMLYRQPLLPFQKWRYPQAVRSFCKAWILPLLMSSNVQRPSLTNVQERTPRPPAPRTSNHDADTIAQASTENPPEEQISALESMGFQREDVLAALRMSGNDTNRAAALLLDGQEGQNMQ
ncbi:uncharacterized protein BJ171DRAFT_537028 [Polychytrium aggregatum]|uniref:uncharacterized protein n=1 Tax=Polychytrium aggregatum TaxID=110093 RepID=UPI0022FF2D22|nr:uncharacterized protein BJ171DRAFT_543797 [Polychytrium aggregatum]XP_052961889.1 uncharacterized protein BJ171DRAFT_537028 [Polychytrium aggregatum]KAI9190601.1 hypothetical protein BJ171DRAFT_543797 [Polychytrium aggregatum]KAI9192951.1 hypothetical protein BJ171DRAFT_537028 [Polychytrium aggregatum]